VAFLCFDGFFEIDYSLSRCNLDLEDAVGFIAEDIAVQSQSGRLMRHWIDDWQTNKKKVEYRTLYDTHQ
jgi:hypothetical protein